MHICGHLYILWLQITLFDSYITRYKIYFLLSIISFLFIQNLNLILVDGFVEEFIYEFGGMLIIIYLCYHKLSKNDL